MKLLVTILFSTISCILVAQTSINNGAWTNNSNWNTGSAPDKTLSFLQTINIHSIISSNSDISVETGSTLNIGEDSNSNIDSLIITAELLSSTASDININSDGVLYIDGDLNNNWAGNINIDGELVVTGDVNNSSWSGVKINNGGKVKVEGDFYNGNNSSIDIDNGGELTVNGTLTNNGSITNDGAITTGNYTGNPPTGSGTLPIKLTYFKATVENNFITLYWQTASEENNDYFTIERSADGINYNTIATIKGSGNSNNTINYTYSDKHPINKTSYYRLTQTDYNGESETFDPVSVSFFKENGIAIGPNPATDKINIIISNVSEKESVSIYTLSGQLIKTTEITSNYATINISEIPKGIYMVVISSGDNKISKRIIKQ